MNVKFYNNNKPWFYTVKKNDEMEKFDLTQFLKKFNFDKSQFENLNGKIQNISCGSKAFCARSY